MKLQDPNFVAPKMTQTLAAASGLRLANGAVASSSKVTVSHAENDERKRLRDLAEGEEDDDGREGKKRRGDGDDMEMDEDDDDAAPASSGKRLLSRRS